MSQATTSRKSSPSRKKKPSLNLAPYIRLEKEQLAPRNAIFQGVEFHLDSDAIAEIQIAKNRGDALNLPEDFLADFRYYALFHPITTFCTYYPKNGSEAALIRSTISLDGNITNQVCHDCLSDGELAAKLISTHSWLIQQLTRRLHFYFQRKVDALAWLLSIAMIAIVLLCTLPTVREMPQGLWMLPILMAWLLQKALKPFFRWILPRWQKWLFRQLLFGSFSRSDRGRKRALSLLHWLEG
ncbi:hypothetical protein IQ249_20685 [Lusitaniella coriacea LEGE 07157]|uniref:Uncharacterized protein n=1 Tax=Lusitaniella coriacea LEGE 07157 TaxID=945747 RepID=A0A8J7DZN1_9CYAN|nr:hypothetical protein [Lusitaniella coriacea]MBE9118313.1 hypothetical protein [Lusitaniella coriacea LEGE 07157]